MAWGGKVVGAGMGAVLGGPVGAAVGAGLGAVWDGIFEDDGPSVELQRVQYDTVVTSHGAGVRWVISFSSDAPIPDDCLLVVRMKRKGKYVRSKLEEYSDNDGDLAAAGPVEFEPGRTAGAGIALLPTRAFATWPRDVEVEATLVTQDGANLAQGSAEFSWPSRSDFEDGSLLGALVHACIGLVCSDGALERSEVRYLREFMRVEFELLPSGDQALKDLMKRARDRPASPADAAELMRLHMTDGLAEPVLNMLYAIADADGHVSRLEEAWISSFCVELGISLQDRATAKQAHAADLEGYRKLLDVEPGASKAEIKRAYRRQAADYHPDKVANLPSGFQEFATERMRQLNEAYTILSNHA